MNGMIRRIFAIAGQEIRLGLRNRWILLSAVILALFSLALALLGSAPAGTVDADRMTVTVASLASLSVYLVPLIALLLAFDAVAGEIDRGTLQLIFSCPVSRGEFLIGKAIGHFTVIVLALLLGYGVTALMLVATGGSSPEALVDFARLIATSALLGLAFLAIGYVLSALSRQANTAAALSVAVWLLVVVLYDLALLGILVAEGSGFFASKVFPFALIANPADAFRLFNLHALGASDLVGGMAGIADALPYPPVAALAAIGASVVLALAVAIALVRRITP